MAEFYQQFSEIEEFNASTPEDKLRFGDLWADQIIATDERFQESPEIGEFLRSEIRTDVQTELDAQGVTEQRGTLGQLVLGEGQEFAPGEFTETLGQVLGPGVAGDITGTFAALQRDFKTVTTQSMTENLGSLGNNIVDVFKHTVGIPARTISGLAQLPHAASAALLDAAGAGDSALAQWNKQSYATLQGYKEQATIFNNVLTQFETDVIAGGLVGAGAGAAIHKFTHRALNGAAKVAATPGFTTADAAILSAASAATGEAIVVAPTLRVMDHYIGESGYTEGTKQVLRATLPLLVGITSGLSIERYMDAMIKNPLVVNTIMDSAARGLGPDEMTTEVRKVVEFPSPVETIGKQTNDRLPIESTTLYGEDFNVVANFRYGAEFPPIRVGVEPGVRPPMTQARMLKSDMVDAENSRSVVAEIMRQSNEELTGEGAKLKYFDGIGEAVATGRLSEEDGLRAVSLSDDTSGGWLFSSDPADIDQALRRVGLTGQVDSSLHKWSHAHLHNEAGYATPEFIKQVSIHGLPLMTGWEIDSETNQLEWDVNKYMKWGAPFNAAFGGGAVFRRIGGNKAIKFVGSKVATKLWDNVAKVPLLKKPLFSLRTTEGLIPEALDVKKQFRVGVREFLQEGDEFVGNLRKTFKPDEMELMSDFIEKEGRWAEVPELLRNQTKVVQNKLGLIRKQLEDSGMDKELLNRLGDKWLHRVYIPKNLNKRVYKNVRRSMKGIQAHYLNERGKNKNIFKQIDEMLLKQEDFSPEDTVFSFVDGKAKRHWIHESQVEKLKQFKDAGLTGREWKVKESAPGRVRVNSDFNKAERENMGESRDLGVRLQAFFRESAQDITLGNIFREVSENPNLALVKTGKQTAKTLTKKAKKRGFVKMPNTKTHSGINKFGLLNGQWVHPDVATTLKSMTKKRFEDPYTEMLFNLNKKAVSKWKIAKTAYSPPTHVVNTVSNIFISTMGGYNPVQVLAEGMFHLVQRGELFQESVKAGLKDSGIIRGEWDVREFAKATSTLTGAPEDAGLITKALHGAFKGGKELLILPQHVYQWEDEMFKLGVIAAERRKGRSIEEALAEANKFFFDYSDVPSGVEFLRDTGAIPFISWTYKIIPTVLRTIRDNPERIVAMIAAIKLVNDWNYEREFGAEAKQQAALEQELRPEFQQKGLFGTKIPAQVRLGSDPITGEARSLDVSRYIPGSDLFQDTFQGFPFGTHPLVSLTSGLVNNRAPFTGQKIEPFPKPKNAFEESENFDGKMKFIINTTLPSLPFIPYTYSSERIGNVLVGTGDINENSGWLWDLAQRRGWTGKNYFGHDLNVVDETLSSVGIGIRRMDVDQALAQERERRLRAVTTAPQAMARGAATRDIGRFRSTLGRQLKQQQGITPQRQEALERLQELQNLTNALEQ